MENSAKAGILHDYDLMANAEPSAHDHVCVVCGMAPIVYQWSDYHGEAMCCQCGTPYQLKAGSEKQKAEGKYPYLNLREVFVPVVREYYKETRCFTYLGSGFDRPGFRAFYEWVEAHHPELIEPQEQAEGGAS